MTTRLLFLGVHSHGRSPSQRYRFEQFEASLSAAGFDIEYSGVVRDDEAKIFYGAYPPTAKLGVAAKAFARRAWSVTPRVFRRRFDVVFVQREAFFLLNGWSEWLAAQQAPLVFDFDDAIWIHAVSEANRCFAFLKNVKKVEQTVRLAHTVIAGNEYLANWARPLSSNVAVVPTCVDTVQFAPSRVSSPADGRVTIGYSGSPSTIEHFKLAVPVLERLRAKYRERLVIRVMGAPGYECPSLGVKAESWSPERELELLRATDIGLMPLPDDEWARGKCGLKGLVSMSMGIATVMSPVGVNRDIIRHGENGFLANAPDEWFARLSELIDDAALRRRLGDAGRRTVEQHYSVERWKQPLATILQTAAEAR